MQPYRLIVPRSAAVPYACGKAASPSSRSIFSSPFFQPFNHSVAGGELAPLFRILDSVLAPDQEEQQQQQQQRRHHHRRPFTPRFDVRERDGAFELQGEVPGLEREGLSVEFVDERTLVVKGRVENSAQKADDNNEGVAEEKEKEKEEPAGSYHKASVEDEDGFIDAAAEAEAEPLNSTSTTSPAAAEDPATSVPDSSTIQNNTDEAKYWLRERRTSAAELEFERRFVFPGRVDQDAVKASLRNGILSVVVPKIVQEEARRVEVL